MSSRRFKYPIKVFYSDEDEGYIALVPDLPGCSAWGATETEVLLEAQDAAKAWLKAAKKMNRSIPEPYVEVINSINGQPEYVLLPIHVYRALKKQIEAKLKEADDYVAFELEDYVDNPVALARIKMKVTQEELAKAMDVSQAYISKLEAQSRVTAKVLDKVESALTVPLFFQS